jgi:uncharacterized phage protein (TIGR02220 family)
MKAQEFLQKYSTKKDALNAINFCLLYCDSMFKDDLFKLHNDVESFQDKDLAQEVIDLFNDVNGTQYTNTEKIKAIIKGQPKVTFDQFASIIYHKYETWSNDPKMKEFLRPATLFGSINKFKSYLDDATNYWIQKAKANG